jgi:S-(hydroxymethyl)glutathione dehydrogenase/alcohol dehydrogenase
MKAAILVAQNQPLVVDEVEMPDTLAPGQVEVELSHTGICGAQLGEIAGAKGPDPFLPHLLGHEGVGRVVTIGPGVSHVVPGQTVVLHWRPGVGIEAATPTYRWQGRPLRAGRVTTFNQRAIVSENRVTPIPPEIDPAVAPLLGCAVTTALGTLVNNARLGLGESVVVLGAGGVGLSIVQGAALMGAYPVVAVDLFAAKLALARKLGATHILAGGEGDLAGAIAAIVGPGGADVVIECTGRIDLIETAYEITGAQGRVVLVGVPIRGQRASLYTLPLHFGKVLTGSHGGEARPAVDIPRYVRLHLAGKLDLAPLVTDRFTLDDINLALDKVRAGEVTGRAIVELA